MTITSIDTALQSKLPRREKRNFTLLLIGQTTSVIGTQTTSVALPLLAVGLAGTSSLSISMIAVARYLPFLFLSVPVGILTDRFDLRRLMIAADAARLLLLALLPVLYYLGGLTMTGIIAAVLFVASARVVFDLSLAKYVVVDFDKDSWITVNSGIDAFTNTGELLGPPFAGAIAGTIGAVWALVLDAFTYVSSLVTLLFLHPADTPPQVRAVHSPGAEKPSMPVAARLIWRNRALRLLATGGALQNFALMAMQGVSVFYMVKVLHLSSLETGLVIAGLGVGTAVGAAVAPACTRRWRALPLTWATAPMAVLGPVSLLVEPEFSAAPFLGYALMGLSISLVSVLARRYRQGCVPAELFGRVSGLYSTVLMGMLPAGAAFGGFMSTYVSFSFVLWTSTLVFGLAALSMTTALRRSPGN